MPKRIKRSRKKGWRKPDNAVIVDRTSRWGNPFKKVGDMIYCDASHRRKVLDKWVFFDGPFPEANIQQMLVDLYAAWVFDELPKPGVVGHMMKPCPYGMSDIIRELKGKDLVCFCSLNKPCHSQVLLEIANSGLSLTERENYE